MTKVLVSFTGNNGAGAISVPGLKTGDEVVSVLFNSGGAVGQDNTAGFSLFVLNDDELIQLEAADRSGFTFTALLERDVVIS